MTVSDNDEGFWSYSEQPNKRQKTSICNNHEFHRTVPSPPLKRVSKQQNKVSDLKAEHSEKPRKPKHRTRVPKCGVKSLDQYFPNVAEPTPTPSVFKAGALIIDDKSSQPVEGASATQKCHTGVGFKTLGDSSLKKQAENSSQISDDDAFFATQRLGNMPDIRDKTVGNSFDNQIFSDKTQSDDGVEILSSNERRNSSAAGSMYCENVVEVNENGDKCKHQGNETSTVFKATTLAGGELDLADQLADLPSDAFSSSPSSPEQRCTSNLSFTAQITLRKSKQSFSSAKPSTVRQTTLFGDALPTVPLDESNVYQNNKPSASRNEIPTHHTLNQEELKTWIYPTNLGAIRDYQFNIVSRGLYHNLLVALPTGLGKTFIAATVMLNWFRWTKDAQIIFVAPTKPLVAQQVEACFGIAGIPKSQTALLTGGISPGLRAEAWAAKRVFFLTPQTIMNDLKTGICDPKRVVLLVVDEAHRATGSYAYVEIIRFLRRFNESFRVLALTATPGSSVESVQSVIDGLNISRVEIRTEASLDIQKYVYSRRSDVVLFDNSPEMEHVMELFSNALQPVVTKLCQLNAYWFRDPMRLTAFGLTLARQKWMSSDAGKKAPMSLKAMVNNIFTVLASLAHGIELLKYHGITPFFHNVLAFQTQYGSGNGKTAKEILDSEDFKKMMGRLRMWTNDPTFIGHPKLEHLQQVVVNHFLDAGEGRKASPGDSTSAQTRVMIFAQYRDSAEEIARVLKRHSPVVRPHVFIGQAAGKRSEGMDQKRQLEILKDFKSGKFNTIVATSIGEEGLDIGEIDLIICYDSSASPIRMLQRAGRTGRKRAGRILLLLMNGKESDSFSQAKDNYGKMQAMIASGKRFRFHDDKSSRIMPMHVQPSVDRRNIEIPTENVDGGLPEPKARGKVPKRPAKRFNMPTGVETGFTKASGIGDRSLQGSTNITAALGSKARIAGRPAIEPVPRSSEVVLSAVEESKFTSRYLQLPGDDITIIYPPRRTAFPQKQRVFGQTHIVTHGKRTELMVKTLDRMHNVSAHELDQYQQRKVLADIDQLCGPDRSTYVNAKAPFESAGKPSPNATMRQEKSKLNHSGQAGLSTSELRTRPAKASDVAEDINALDANSSSSVDLLSQRLQMPSQGLSLGSADTSGWDEKDVYDSDLAEFVVSEQDTASSPRSDTSSMLSVALEKSDVLTSGSSNGSRDPAKAASTRISPQRSNARGRKVIRENAASPST